MGIPASSRVAMWSQGLFYVNGAVWLCLGTLSLALAWQSGEVLRWVLSGLMLGNALLMAWFGIKLRRAQPRIYLLAIIYIAVNAVLTITDQFGPVDLLVLLLNLVLLGMLLVARRRTLQTTNAP